jgi:hypothetical protein
VGEQSATRLKGDDYQHLYSWFELLQLLMPESPFPHGYVEHPQAGAADDITLHPQGRQDRAKYTQVKFHVDQRAQYSSASLVKRAQDDARSLLHKLFASWNHYGIKDWAMAKDASCGFMLWDGISKGTPTNVINLLDYDKKVLLFSAPKKQFFTLRSSGDLDHTLRASGIKDVPALLASLEPKQETTEHLRFARTSSVNKRECN